MAHVKCCLRGKFFRDSVSGVFMGLVTRVASNWYVAQFLTPRRRAGVQYKPHWSYKAAQVQEAAFMSWEEQELSRIPSSQMPAKAQPDKQNLQRMTVRPALSALSYTTRTYTSYKVLCLYLYPTVCFSVCSFSFEDNTIVDTFLYQFMQVCLLLYHNIPFQRRFL